MAKLPPHHSRIQEQLQQAWESSGLLLDQLLRLTRLRISAVSLWRKLNGQQALMATEIDVLARVLRVRVCTGRGRDLAA